MKWIKALIEMANSKTTLTRKDRPYTLSKIYSLLKTKEDKAYRESSNREIEQMNAKRERIHKEKMHAIKMAWDNARSDTNYSEWIVLRHRKELEGIAIDGPLIGGNHVRIHASVPGGCSCPSCIQMNNKVFPLEKEQECPHLPVKGCTCTAYHSHQTGFCLCWYDVVFDDELD